MNIILKGIGYTIAIIFFIVGVAFFVTIIQQTPTAFDYAMAEQLGQSIDTYMGNQFIAGMVAVTIFIFCGVMIILGIQYFEKKKKKNVPPPI